jgi:DNA-binding GntR family transcriptional regulator
MGLSKLYPRVYIIQNIVQGFDVKAPDTAYEKLFHAIEIGEIGPGERLLEIELAKRFGVSRTPIREAIRKLESEGIIQHLPRVGAVVRQLGQPEIVELYEMRIVLEATAAEMAAQHASHAEIETMIALNDDMAEGGYSGHDIARINRRFHLCIVDAARNQFLKHCYHDLSNTLMLLGKTTLDTAQRVQIVCSQHSDIITALQNRDPAQAAQMMRIHMQTSLSHRLKAYHDQH